MPEIPGGVKVLEHQCGNLPFQLFDVLLAQIEICGVGVMEH